MTTPSRTKLGLALALILTIILSLWIIHRKSSTDLTPEKLAQVYVKLAIAYQCSGSDIPRYGESKERILKEYDLSLKKINQFTAKCNRNPLVWTEFFERATNLLRQEHQILTNKTPAP